MKKILITGAASGLGKAIAQLYASKGWLILAVDIQDDLGTKFVNELNSTGYAAEYYHCDIGQHQDFISLFEQVSSKHDCLDILVNNAGVASAGKLENTDQTEWNRLINLDLLSVVYGTKTLLPLLKQSKKAHIVSTASFAGVALMPGMMTYNVAKAGVIAFSETLHGEMSVHDIGVSVVCPAFFETNLVSSMGDVNPKTKKFIDKQMKVSGVSADDVAQDIFDAVNKNKFMVISHKQSRLQYLMKRFFPIMFLNKKANIYKKMQQAGVFND